MMCREMAPLLYLGKATASNSGGGKEGETRTTPEDRDSRRWTTEKRKAASATGKDRYSVDRQAYEKKGSAANIRGETSSWKKKVSWRKARACRG